MSNVLFYCLTLVYCAHPAQERSDFIGKWEVISAEISDQVILEDEAKKQFEPFIDAFIGSVFEFNRNGTSTFKTRIPQFSYNKYQWDVNGGESQIDIRETKSSARTLGILAAVVDGKTMFYLIDTPFILLVEKK